MFFGVTHLSRDLAHACYSRAHCTSEVDHANFDTGASVHIRNKSGRTPLFLAANSGLTENVAILKQSGAHLHTVEMASAKSQARAHLDL